jgi:predicted transcriptional regulator
MEVHFTPDQEAQLSQIAKHASTDTEQLVKDAALRLVEENTRFHAAVRESLAQADRGELIDDNEVGYGWSAKSALEPYHPPTRRSGCYPCTRVI